MLDAGMAATLDGGALWSHLVPVDRDVRMPLAPVRTESGAAWQPSTYQASRSGNPVALAASLLIVGGLLASLAWLDVAPAIKARHDIVVVALSATPPPPSQLPAQHVRQAAPSMERPQIVAPPPIVTSLATPTPVAAPQPMPVPTRIAAPAVPTASVAAPTAPPQPAQAGDLSSTMISAKPPIYPIDSRRSHEEGTVVLKLLLGTDGRVSDISVYQSSGSDRLDDAALSAVRKWRWKPVVRDGEAVIVEGMVTIPFVLTH